MDFTDFLYELRKLNMGVISFNTYDLEGINCCFIMVGDKGDSGAFYKNECKSSEFGLGLEFLLDAITESREYNRWK